jgi:DNA-binding response OmpR family regulator
MVSQAPRILLVDDEQAVQTLLTYPLRKDGYDVVSAGTGQEALDRFREGEFDLVVLDVMLPQVDGFEVCRALRARSAVPIIMLTAKTEEFDKVLGLELGADDYITKPFSMREFRSRVKAVLRRADLNRNGDDAPDPPLEDRDLRMDFGKRHVEVRGAPVKLTYVEFEILAILARSPGRVFSRMIFTVRGVGYHFRDR